MWAVLEFNYRLVMQSCSHALPPCNQQTCKYDGRRAALRANSQYNIEVSTMQFVNIVSSSYIHSSIDRKLQFICICLFAKLSFISAIKPQTNTKCLQIYSCSLCTFKSSLRFKCLQVHCIASAVSLNSKSAPRPAHALQ